MIITVLAIAFLVLVGFITFVGYKAVIQRTQSSSELNVEKCSLCREKFDTKDLVMRQVGDYKLLYFCRECILKLYGDLGLKN